jgi:glycosyltransferase involved in cell wall biosynthesis
MSTVVNGRFLSRRVTGVERYAGEILRHLPEKPRLLRPTRSFQGASGHFWEQFVLPAAIHPRERLWSPANTGPLLVADQVLTLHDLTPLEHPAWFSPAFSAWYRLFIPILVRRVRRVVVSSAYMKRKIILRFALPEQRVTVVPGGVDVGHFRPDYPRLRNSPDTYLLFVGTLQPRKNLSVLLKAWSRVCHRFPGAWLCLAGGMDHNLKMIAFDNPVERVHYYGYVSDNDLAELYAGAQACVLPSLEEGFGLTILEAMACGTSVIAAQAGSLPEVVGEAGLLFHPDNPEELAEQMEVCLGKADIRRALSEKGLQRVKDFSWQISAEKIQEILQS